RHCVALAASRARASAGSSSAMSSAMMDITTSNSIRVKPPDPFWLDDAVRFMAVPPHDWQVATTEMFGLFNYPAQAGCENGMSSCKIWIIFASFVCQRHLVDMKWLLASFTGDG